MELPNELLSFLIGIIAILSFVAGLFRWKIAQIQKDTRHHVNTTNNTNENHKDINQLKEIVIRLETAVNSLCDRTSRLEGAFNQHNREKDH